MSFKLFHVIESRDDFSSAISEHDVCVVDFFGTWCGPCTTLATTLTNVAQHDLTLRNAHFIKVDVDEFSDLAEVYGVTALPYLIFFKNGKQTEFFVKGNRPDEVVAIVKELLSLK